MPKIKKIKRDQITELGEEFDVLSDTEAADSGITLEADEVIIVEKPAPSSPAGGNGDPDEVATLRNRLHTVNQESAQRRITLRQQQDQLKALDDQNKLLLGQVSELKTSQAKKDAQALFDKHVSAKKIQFVSAEAGEDIREIAFGQVDWTKPVTEEILAPLIDGTVEKKKYAIKQVTLPRTDGGKTSDDTEGVVDIDLNAVATAFNIPYKEPKEQSK